MRCLYLIKHARWDPQAGDKNQEIGENDKRNHLESSEVLLRGEGVVSFFFQTHV